MVKTEAKRAILKTNIVLPRDVRVALDEWNRTKFIKLDILWDDDTEKWQIYKIKAYGAVADDDLLHWQMSAPVTGTGITPGILDWLRKYDTTNGGLLDQDEIKKKWLNDWKKLQAIETSRKKKKKEEFNYGYKWIIDKLSGLREQISVPKTVGMHKGKTIRAVPKGTAKAMKRSLKRGKC